MSQKNRDEHNRWRNKTIAFRVSPEENEQLERCVRLSGLTKQDYILHRLENRSVVELGAVAAELRRIEAGAGIDDELLATIKLLAEIMNGMKEEC